MTIDVKSAECLIEQYGELPEKDRLESESKVLHEVIAAINTPKKLPAIALERLRRACLQNITPVSQARHFFNLIHTKCCGVNYYKKNAPTPFVKKHVERQVKVLSKAEALLFEQLRNKKNISAKKCLAIILFTSAVNAGLCHEPGLTALMKAILEQKNNTFKTSGAERYIRLNYTAPGHPVNVKTEYESYTSQIFYPTPIVTASILGFLRAGGDNIRAPESPLTLIKELVAQLLGEERIMRVSSAVLYEAMSLVFARKPGARVPSFLTYYAAGKSNTVSTFDQCLLSFNSSHIAKVTHQSAAHCRRKASNSRGVYKRNLVSSSDQLLDDIRELLNRYKNAPPEPEAIANGLRSVVQNRQRPISEAAAALHSFFMHKYKKNIWKTPGTGLRNLSSLGKIWCYFTENIILEEFDVDAMSELHRKLVEGENNADSAFLNSLRQFWLYMHDCLGYELPEQLNRHRRGARYVRCAIPSPLQVRRLFIDIQNSYSGHSQHERDSVSCILILMARLGLRPAEALHLEVKDIDLRGAGKIFIRTNKHFTPKSFCGYRKLPVRPFLLEDEERFLRSFVRRRQTEVGKDTYRLLFSTYEFAGQLIDYEKLSAEASRLLSNYSGVHINLYQLRHFALSCYQLTCFASLARAQSWTGFDIAQVEAIRRHFHQTPKEDVLSEIRSFAGHLTTHYLMSTYFHFSDILRYEAAMRVSHRIDVRILSTLAGIQAGRVIRYAKNEGFHGELSNNELEVIIDKVLKTERRQRVKKIKPRNSRLSSKIPSFNRATQPNLEHVEKILKARVEGIPLQEIADVFNLTLDFVERVIAAAKYLRDAPEFRTKHHRPRLYRSDLEHHLTVAMPQPKEQISELLDLLQKFQTLKPMHTKRVLKAAETLLRHSTYGRTSVTLTCRKDLEQIMKALDGIVDPSKWLLTVLPNHSENAVQHSSYDYWKEKMPSKAAVELATKEDCKSEKHGRGKLAYMNASPTEKVRKMLENDGIPYQRSGALTAALHYFLIFQYASKQRDDSASLSF
ncbi:site-specific integrase [Idiomarina sp.]|uniref:site-specific integrase n=1 Tax=Idiomarina sp. TaxID=1874361 RepID=UPI001DC77159|nr:site-specific integrase [Idiomarina sp.]MCJ8317890.1 site-specific integrase [Idiomarina sp.]NQZ17413.1 site-specific integrase [Idiomarina sp.]